MPAVTKGKVLVSGCNGYLAVWVVKQLLEDGYAVRGTVRRDSAIPYLKNLFQSYGDRFEAVIVPDITKEGAFDEAVKGVDAIEHTASPFHLRADDPQEIIGPAVAGTLGVLRSALALANDTVRRVVITSSCSAVLTEPSDRGVARTFSEADWNEFAVDDVAAHGRDAPAVQKYHASKTLAERAAWEFMQEHKGDAKFDVVALNPPYVYGPWLNDVDKPEQLGTSMAMFYDVVVKGNRSPGVLASEGQSWVDVRDVAVAHSRALSREEAGGERIIISSGPWVWDDFSNAAHKTDPRIPAGSSSVDPNKVLYYMLFDNSKSRRLLGLEYRDIEDCTRECVAQVKASGWL